MRLVAALVVVLAASLPSDALGKGAKTISVRGYTRKDGTYVRPHMRSPPGGGSSSYSAPRTSYSTSPRSSYRKSASSSARSGYSLGSLGTLYESAAVADDDGGPPLHNVPPNEIFLSPSVVFSRPADKTVVGTLSAVDPNPTDRHQFMLLSHQDRFAVDGRALVVLQGRLIDRRKNKTLNVHIAAVDQSGAKFDKRIPISVVRGGQLGQKYLAYFKSGRTKELADYLEQSLDYIFIGTDHSIGRFPKSMIRAVEKIGEAEDKAAVDRPMRDWSDDAGSHHVRASYAGLNSGKVQLLKENGKHVLVAFEKLSDVDQQYVLKTFRDEAG